MLRPDGSLLIAGCMEMRSFYQPRTGIIACFDQFKAAGHRLVVSHWNDSTQSHNYWSNCKTRQHSGLPPNGNWISQLARRCRRLQKLVLTAARVVNDADLNAIAQYCTSILQLDLLGNSYLSAEGCSRSVL